MLLTQTESPTLPLPLAREVTFEATDGNVVESSALLARTDLESLFFNVDASLGVHSRAQFFSWTQGMLQSLIQHEVLVCAMRSGELLSFRVESFSSVPTESGAFGKLFLRDAGLVPTLVKQWEGGRYRPIVCDVEGDGPFMGSQFAREMSKLGATTIVTHGTHDVSGYTESLFTFACRPGAAPKTHSYLAQFVVPFLHAAWVRSHVVGGGAGRSLEAVPSNPLTTREREILRWIYLGKSNFEIGAILTISPLTVKNHVRKILRKLDVVNRTQAIGKALELRILNV